MPEDVQRAYNNSKAEAKTPIWNFAGLAIIACLIAFGVYSSNQNDADNLTYLETPAVGDLYKYKLDGEYSTMKVIDLVNDSIDVVLNNYVINKRSKIYKINKEENYIDGKKVRFSKASIKSMFESGEIYDIDRD